MNEIKKSLYYQKIVLQKEKLNQELDAITRNYASALSGISIGMISSITPVVLSNQISLLTEGGIAIMSVGTIALCSILYKEIKHYKQIKRANEIIKDYEEGEIISPRKHLKVTQITTGIPVGYKLIKPKTQTPEENQALNQIKIYINEVPVAFPKSQTKKPLLERDFGIPIKETYDFNYELDTEATIKKAIKQKTLKTTSK